MNYAIRKDSLGWRAVNGPDDVGADETFSDTQPEPVVDIASAARALRLPLLDAADKAINGLEDIGSDASAWRTYRQALRDVTDQKGFPNKIIWPTAPGSI